MGRYPHGGLFGYYCMAMVSLPLLVEPDPDVPEFASLFVDGMIDGRPYRFLLDTGAAQSRVVSDAHTSTAAVVGDKQSNSVFGVALADELVVLKSLVVGPIEKSDLTVVRSAGKERPNLVGMDVLGDMALTVDFDRAEVRFAPGGSPLATWPVRRGPRGHVYLDLDFSGVIGNACWDTGSSATVVDTGFVAAHRELFMPMGASVGTDATGASRETPLYRMAAATVGGIKVAAHTVAAVALPRAAMRMDMVLGYPALRQFNWAMDFPGNRWDATPAGVPESVPET